MIRGIWGGGYNYEWGLALSSPSLDLPNLSCVAQNVFSTFVADLRRRVCVVARLKNTRKARHTRLMIYNDIILCDAYIARTSVHNITHTLRNNSRESTTLNSLSTRPIHHVVVVVVVVVPLARRVNKINVVARRLSERKFRPSAEQ